MENVTTLRALTDAHVLLVSSGITVKLILMNVSTIPVTTTEHVTTLWALIYARVLLGLMGDIV